MERRLANTWRQSMNEKKFIETALAADVRIDGRNPFEYRKLSIQFGREDGSSEVQLGETHVMAIVTGQLVEPYRDRPNEGSLSIFTEFSPMADPSFEPGRPSESAVELGRVVDRGLRESKAVDTESLCVLAGRLAWAIRIDLHILDNCGNLVDAANIAALAALLTFRRPECTLGGESGQEVIIHPPEARDPLPLIVHHLPIAVTFAFIGSEGKVVVDPTHCEEVVMGGRMTVTVNANSDICAIQKAGGHGVPQSVIIHCLQLASKNAESMTKKIKDAVEAYTSKRALDKVKRHCTSLVDVSAVVSSTTMHQHLPDVRMRVDMERLKLTSNESNFGQCNDLDEDVRSSELGKTNLTAGNNTKLHAKPSNWDPYSKGVDIDALKASLASRDIGAPVTNHKREDKKNTNGEPKIQLGHVQATALTTEPHRNVPQTTGAKTLKDAVKPKHKRRKQVTATMDTS